MQERTIYVKVYDGLEICFPMTIEEDGDCLIWSIQDWSEENDDWVILAEGRVANFEIAVKAAKVAALRMAAEVAEAKNGDI